MKVNEIADSCVWQLMCDKDIRSDGNIMENDESGSRNGAMDSMEQVLLVLGTRDGMEP